MGAASAVTGGLSAGIGIYQAIQGAKEKRDAKKALENYKRQELENVAEDLQVSTLGADRQLAEQSRLASTQIGALQGGGTRALLGGLGRVEAGNQAVNDQITADLDQQRKQIDQMIASDNANIRSMQENRENADINALSSQYQSGKQDMNMGIGNALQGIGSVANQFGAKLPQETPQVESVNSLTPIGIQSQKTLPTADMRHFERPQFNYGGIGVMKPRNRFVNTN
jgi:hypothetical protein